MLRGLFEGAQYNSEAGEKCTVYSMVRTKQGRGVIKEIRYIGSMCDQFWGNVPERAKQLEIRLKVGNNFIFNKYLKPVFS